MQLSALKKEQVKVSVECKLGRLENQVVDSSRKQCLQTQQAQAHMTSQRLAASEDCKRSKQTKPQPREEGMDTKSYPLPKSYLQLISAGEENKNHSSPMEFTKYLNYTPGQVPCQQVVEQDKMDSVFHCALFAWFGLVYVFCLVCLIVFILFL